jgi:hypothetical protein
MHYRGWNFNRVPPRESYRLRGGGSEKMTAATHRVV